MKDEGRPETEAFAPPNTINPKATLGIAILCFAIGVAAAGSWFLGPNALGQDQTSHTGRDNTFLFMVLGPFAVPISFYFLYLWRKEKSAAAAYLSAQPVQGTITHLWKANNESADRKYRVGFAAPGIEPQFICVPAARFKKLSLGDSLEVRQAHGKTCVDI